MTMKALRTLALISTLALASSSVAASTFIADLGGGNGTVIDISKPTGKYQVAFVMIGSDADSRLGIITSYTTTATGNLSVAGDFSYLSNDCCGPIFDPFGYIVNGVPTQLTVDDSGSSQVGTFSFKVLPGDTFGWYIDATDDQLGAASVSVGANLTAVPIPATLPLLGAAITGLMALRRRSA